MIDVLKKNISAMAAHGYDADDGREHRFSLINQSNVPIFPNTFEKNIDQYKKCSGFCIELVWEGEANAYKLPIVEVNSKHNLNQTIHIN